MIPKCPPHGGMSETKPEGPKPAGVQRLRQGQKMKLEDQESLSPPRPSVSGECCLCPRYTELTLFCNAMHKLTTN